MVSIDAPSLSTAMAAWQQPRWAHRRTQTFTFAFAAISCRNVFGFSGSRSSNAAFNAAAGAIGNFASNHLSLGDASYLLDAFFVTEDAAWT